MYEVAKILNSILKVYLPTGHMIHSTNEFITIVRATTTPGLLPSPDVESLFTNVPLHATTDIIMNLAYRHPTRKPPTIPEIVMKELLLICTTEAPFKNINGDIYRQIDGLNMGSPLAPLYADFYT